MLQLILVNICVLIIPARSRFHCTEAYIKRRGFLALRHPVDNLSAR